MYRPSTRKPYGITNFAAYNKAIQKKKKLPQEEKKAIRTVVKKYLAPREELKYNFLTYTSYQCDKDQGNAASAYFCLTDNIAQGNADINNRSGDMIYLKTLKFRFMTQVQPNQVSANNIVMFRFILIQLKQSFDSTAAVGSALKALLNPTQFLTPGLDGVNPDPLSQKIHDRRKLYTFLYDTTWVQVNNGSAATSSLNPSMMKCHDINLNMKYVKRQLEYVNGSTTSAINHIIGLCITQNTSATGSVPLFYGTSKIEFTDS